MPGVQWKLLYTPRSPAALTALTDVSVLSQASSFVMMIWTCFLGVTFRDEDLSRDGFIGKPLHHIYNIKGAIGINSTIVCPIHVDHS